MTFAEICPAEQYEVGVEVCRFEHYQDNLETILEENFQFWNQPKYIQTLALLIPQAYIQIHLLGMHLWRNR